MKKFLIGLLILVLCCLISPSFREGFLSGLGNEIKPELNYLMELFK